MLNILVDVMAEPRSVERLRAIPDITLDLVGIPEERARIFPAEKLRRTHILFCSLPPVNFSEMHNLQWVQITSAGYSQLFDLRLSERGILASNGRGVFDIPIAEWNISMMVNLGRNLRGMIRNQERAVWDRDAEFQSEIRGKTVGLWGYGGLGRETARLAKAMGLCVHVLSRRGIRPVEDVYCVPGTGDPEGILPDRVFLAGQELEFLSGLDFLILAMPLTRSTAGSVGERELKALPRHAFLLNPSRGPLVQERALLQALEDGWIRGAAIDTHYQYPLPPEHPLWHFPNVILTPHISGSSGSPHYLERTWDLFTQNLERFRSGRVLINQLTPEQLRGE